MGLPTKIIKLIASKVFGVNLNFTRYLGIEDPYYEIVETPTVDKHGRPTHPKTRKLHRRKRPIPAGINAHDESCLKLVKSAAYRLDMWFGFLGIHVGVSSLFGLIPVVGPVINGIFSFYIYYLCTQTSESLPLWLHAQLLFNIALDFVLGSIPIVGDIILLAYKANSRNCLLLNKHLTFVGERNQGIVDLDEMGEFGSINNLDPRVSKKLRQVADQLPENLDKKAVSAFSKVSETVAASLKQKKAEPAA
ncbi:hypothetical protein BABINDRAFT_161157 [Babjeviella inositovora NRRL Y-12698]|uniref:Uncharacterized protein n=1 Tax=Babjeviella inositovora NRRL Y-12698 TaxID=984486 RepID=A0A1E3QR79_9ASCO|nr:uncharacterized protein BABINDRAFT_161157 [Babjeviella inositovora NRRL Y-12698]ODQ80181.1 hypothetical protein BABINDRAFT_161157 [Babjeviella inositovora NRRL Y-12698]